MYLATLRFYLFTSCTNVYNCIYTLKERKFIHSKSSTLKSLASSNQRGAITPKRCNFRVEETVVTVRRLFSLKGYVKNATIGPCYHGIIGRIFAFFSLVYGRLMAAYNFCPYEMGGTLTKSEFMLLTDRFSTCTFCPPFV